MATYNSLGGIHVVPVGPVSIRGGNWHRRRTRGVAYSRRSLVIAGHFGFAAIVKAREPRTPLWALMLACQWLDVIFVPLFLAGIETIRPADGTAGHGYGEGVIYADWTHSLVGALALSALFGGVAAAAWGRRSGLVLGAVVASHWLLDLLVHRADMPILPANAGGLPRVGLGLWRVPLLSLGVELALVGIGALLYGRAALAAERSSGRSGRRATIATALILVSGVITLALSAFGL
jgi:hypothetical protein